jgi:cysteine desulfurase
MYDVDRRVCRSQFRRVIYLDHQTLSPVRPGVIAQMQAAAAEGGNASSLHALGRGARRRLTQARDALHHLCGGGGETVFCGSYAESQTLAVQGLAAGVRRRTNRSTVIFDAAFWRWAPRLAAMLADAGFTVLRLDGEVQANGQVWATAGQIPGGQRSAASCPINPRDICLMVARLADPAAAPGFDAALINWAQASEVPLVVDAALAAGRLPLHFDAWGLTGLIVAGAPLGGPPGTAAVILRADADLVPLWGGGGQQGGRRPGTEALAPAVGLGAAATHAEANRVQGGARLATLRGALCWGWDHHLVKPTSLMDMAVLPLTAATVVSAVATLGQAGLCVGWGPGAGVAPPAPMAAGPGGCDAHLVLALGWNTDAADIAGARCALTHLLGPPKTSPCELL